MPQDNTIKKPTEPAQKKTGSTEPRNGLVVLLLAFFLGYLGIHRFYVGDKKYGIIMLVLGIFTLFIISGIWAIIDCIMILLGKFKDSEGRVVKL